MKILLEDKDNAILLEVAQHLNVELANPKLLYEIGHPALVAVAIALGGIQWLETERQPAPASLRIVDPEFEKTDLDLPEMGRDLDQLPDETATLKKVLVKETFYPAKSLILLDTGGNICEICGKVFLGDKRAKVCSPECKKEKSRRYQADRVRRRKAAGAAAEPPLA